MKRLLIVGAGGFGREVLQWAKDIEPTQSEWKIGGFLNSLPNALDGYDCGYLILGHHDTFSFGEDDVVVCALGDAQARLNLCRSIKARGAVFTTLVHPTCIVGERSQIGEGCILCPYSTVTVDAHVGDYVIIMGGTVGHDAAVGDGCTLSPRCDVAGFVQLGEGVSVGTQAVLLPKAKVGDYAVIGAGSVVLRRVQPYATVMGVPARQIYGFAKGKPGGQSDEATSTL